MWLGALTLLGFGFVLILVAVVIILMGDGEGGCLAFCIGGAGLIVMVIGIVLLAIDMSTPVSAVLPGAVQYLDAMYLI